MKKSNLKIAALSGMALFVSAVVSLSSCSADAEEVMNNSSQLSGPSASVRVHVSDFSISVEEFSEGRTRAVQDVADYTNVKAVDLAFYDGDTEILKATQVKGDGTYTTFGEFDCSLPLGTYTMVVVGRGWFDGDVFTLTSPTEAGYTSGFTRETFCATQSVTVTAAGADVSIALNRINSGIQIMSTDGRPAGVAKIRTTYTAGSKSFNPTSGLATSDTGFSVTNTPSATVGNTINTGNFVFLATDEQTMSITLEVLDASDNVLFTKVAENVPFKRNRKTVLSGGLFTAASSSFSFRLDTGWLQDHTVNF